MDLILIYSNIIYFINVQDKYLYDVHLNESSPYVIFLNVVVLMICFDDN